MFRASTLAAAHACIGVMRAGTFHPLKAPSRTKGMARKEAAALHDIGARTEAGSSPDQIFKLIDDWKAAETGHSKAVSLFGVCEKRDGVGVDTAESRAAQKAVDKAEDVASDALRKVCDTPPQTLAGLIALVRAVRPSHENPDGSLHDYSDGRALNLFASMEAALVGLGDRAGGAT